MTVTEARAQVAEFRRRGDVFGARGMAQAALVNRNKADALEAQIEAAIAAAKEQ